MPRRWRRSIRIVKAFQAAIIAKDRAALEAMFLPADNSWLTVASDGIRLTPGQPRVRPSTYQRVHRVRRQQQAARRRALS
jgi:hypothetical protein